MAAEVLCLPEPSLGQRIYYTKYYLDIPELFAWTAVTVALSTPSRFPYFTTADAPTISCIRFAVSPNPLPPEVQNGTIVLPVKS